MALVRVRRELQDRLMRPNVLIPLAAFILFFFIFMLPRWEQLKDVFFIAMFFILGSLSYVYRRYMSVRFGFEFISIGTFLCTLAYGPGIGFFLGNTTSFLAELIGSKVDERIIINLLSINAVVLVTPFLAPLANGGQLLLAAVIMNIVYNIIGVGGNMILGGNPAKTLIFVSTNLFWTFAVFLHLGPKIYELMLL